MLLEDQLRIHIGDIHVAEQIVARRVAVVWIQLHRLSVLRQSIHATGAIFEKVANVVSCGRQLGIFLNRLLEAIEGLGVQTKLQSRCAEVIEIGNIRGIHRHRLVKSHDRIASLAEILVNHAAIAMQCCGLIAHR